MKDLKRSLEARGVVWSPALEAEVRALWKYGVERIQDAALRRAIGRFLAIVPSNFYTEPASKSGKHHVPWQNGDHGVLRSIVESCILVPCLAKHEPGMLGPWEKQGVERQPIPRLLDVAFAGTIISDVWKKDEGESEPHGPWHGKVAAWHWRAFVEKTDVDPALAEEVAQACHWHYGIHAPDWTPDKAFTGPELIVQRCDAVTAQNELALMYRGLETIE